MLLIIDFCNFPFFLFLLCSCRVFLLSANGDAEYAMVSREAVFFKVVRPASLGYVFKALPARNFGKPFVSTGMLGAISPVPLLG